MEYYGKAASLAPEFAFAGEDCQDNMLDGPLLRVGHMLRRGLLCCIAIPACGLLVCLQVQTRQWLCISWVRSTRA